MTRSLLIFCGVVCLSHLSLFAQDGEFQNGLIGRYQSGDSIVERVDPDIAFQWRNAAPHTGTDAKSWTATWSGQLLVRSLTPYQFHVQGSGKVVIEIDGAEVLNVTTDKSQWSSGKPVKISPGFQEIVVRYEPSASSSEIKLFWSSDEFEVEPIPSHHFFFEEDASKTKLIEEGRMLFDSHRCSNCHREEKTVDGTNAAPALWGVTSGTNPEWIVEKLLGKQADASSDRMPHFGFSPEQAEDIASYLHRLEAPFDLMTVPKPKPKKGDPNGEELFNSLGCLACHKVNDLGTTGPFSGSPLTNIGNKRSADWLATWLAIPDRLNPQHRMPTFKLSRTERGLLAGYLSTLGKKKETKFGRSEKTTYTESTVRGQALVKEFQCANCHKIPAIEASDKPAAALIEAPKDWKGSCLAEKADPNRKRPHYPNLNRDAISAYLKSLKGSPQSKLSTFEAGQRVLERRQCLACHSRGSEQGIKSFAKQIAKATPSLQNQTQLVVPPNLNAVGDKLQDAVLDVALSGKQKRTRANWLKIRMPEFNHTKADLAALKHYLIEHDRIPQAASATHPELALSQDELLLVGRKLVGAGGWSCIACHQIGDYVPKNTALGTRGSDLMAIGSRLRPEFYYRWCRSPLRVIPGMEMPSFTKPVHEVLGENPHHQLAAIWSAVNDDRFEPPTNPSQVEQLWQVAGEGKHSRIVRDVFTVNGVNGEETIARAFAIGFSNQNSILIDLDQMAVRDWKYGDFARQRTVGKSWYWDLAGAAVMTGFDSLSDLVLYDEANELHELIGIDPDRIAHLKNYVTKGYHVELNYELRVKYSGKDLIIPVKEVFSPLTVSPEPSEKATGTGWARNITPLKLPAGVRLGYRDETKLTKHFNARIYIVSISTKPSSGSGSSGIGDGFVMAAHPDGPFVSITVNYKSGAHAPQTQIPEKKIVLPSSDKVTTLPGYEGTRLSIPISIMPTAISGDGQGRLLVTSLKGHVFRIADSNGNGLEDKLETLAEGLSAPFGVIADGDDVLVTHKPELLRLIDQDNDGIFEKREVVADGWGHSDNYHDWVTGPVFDKNGSLYLGTGSDYAQPKRDRKLIKWRGTVVRASSDGKVEAVANEFRYPIGIAADSQGRIFVSDQQGVQNTFNEINHIVPGRSYGVPGQADGEGSKTPSPPAVKIPHDWTRSVNDIFFLPEKSPGPFAGHGIGCEFNKKFLIRFTMHEVDGELQGACYPFSHTTWENETNTFLGPISGFAAENGDIYIGSIYDSGWLGGPNVGEIVRLKQTGDYGNGIREIRAVPGGFEIEFISAVDAKQAIDAENYSLSGYTRIWQGSYATDDSGRYSPKIEKVTLSKDHRTVILQVPNVKATFLYEFNIGAIGKSGEELFPSFGAYTLNRIPK